MSSQFKLEGKYSNEDFQYLIKYDNKAKGMMAEEQSLVYRHSMITILKSNLQAFK